MKTIQRTACRGILLTPQNEILLIKVLNGKSGWSGWIAPGGGVKSGETKLAALRRELHEELGLTDFSEPTEIWIRNHTFELPDRRVDQTEHFYLIKIQKFEANPEGLTKEMLDFKEMRWWKFDDLKTTKDEFAPRKFSSLLEDVIKNGTRQSPIEVGA